MTQEGGEQCGAARVVAEVSAYAVSLVRLASGEAGVCGGTAVSLPSRHRPSLGSPSRSLCLPHRPPLGSPSDTAVHVWSGLDVTGAGPVCDEPLPTTATTTCALPPPLHYSHVPPSLGVHTTGPGPAASRPATVSPLCHVPPGPPCHFRVVPKYGPTRHVVPCCTARKAFFPGPAWPAVHAVLAWPATCHVCAVLSPCQIGQA